MILENLTFKGAYIYLMSLLHTLLPRHLVVEPVLFSHITYIWGMCHSATQTTRWKMNHKSPPISLLQMVVRVSSFCHPAEVTSEWEAKHEWGSFSVTKAILLHCFLLSPLHCNSKNWFSKYSPTHGVWCLDHGFLSKFKCKNPYLFSGFRKF